MGRLIDADAFSAFIKDAVIKHKYDRLNIDNTLTVADVLQSVCAELDGTGLEGFKNAPTVDAVPVRRGYWIRHDYADLVDGYYVPNYECSVCHAWKQDDSDYCPDCGALNDGKDGDNGTD